MMSTATHRAMTRPTPIAVPASPGTLTRGERVADHSLAGSVGVAVDAGDDPEEEERLDRQEDPEEDPVLFSVDAGARRMLFTGRPPGGGGAALISRRFLSRRTPRGCCRGTTLRPFRSPHLSVLRGTRGPMAGQGVAMGALQSHLVDRRSWPGATSWLWAHGATVRVVRGRGQAGRMEGYTCGTRVTA